MAKRKRNKAFWNNIRFKYKLTVVNENTLEEVAGLRVSKLNGIYVLATALVLLFSIAAAIIAFTPLRNYLPGYMNSEVRTQIVQNALRMDSLQQVLERQNLYIANIQDIFSGKIKADTVYSLDSLNNIKPDSLMAASQRELDFRQQYEEKEKYNLTSMSGDSNREGLLLCRPAQGVVSSTFDPDNRQYGTDIAVAPKGNIVAVLDGTVVLSAYTAESGYSIGIQHGQNLISFYKNCGELLKSEGDKVKNGEAIAVAKKTDGSSSAPCLHFELWKNGHPVNPENFIIF